MPKQSYDVGVSLKTRVSSIFVDRTEPLLKLKIQPSTISTCFNPHLHWLTPYFFLAKSLFPLFLLARSRSIFLLLKSSFWWVQILCLAGSTPIFRWTSTIFRRPFSLLSQPGSTQDLLRSSAAASQAGGPWRCAARFCRALGGASCTGRPSRQGCRGWVVGLGGRHDISIVSGV